MQAGRAAARSLVPLGSCRARSERARRCRTRRTAGVDVAGDPRGAPRRDRRRPRTSPPRPDPLRQRRALCLWRQGRQPGGGGGARRGRGSHGRGGRVGRCRHGAAGSAGCRRGPPDRGADPSGSIGHVGGNFPAGRVLWRRDRVRGEPAAAARGGGLSEELRADAAAKRDSGSGEPVSGAARPIGWGTGGAERGSGPAGGARPDGQPGPSGREPGRGGRSSGPPRGRTGRTACCAGPAGARAQGGDCHAGGRRQ